MVKLYQCNVCEYTSTSKRAYDKHYSSFRHENKVKMDFVLEKMKKNYEKKISTLTTENIKLREENSVILKQALVQLGTHTQNVDSALLKSLNNNNSTNKVASKTISAMNYTMQYCIEAPDINSLKVKETLKLSVADKKAILHNPMHIAAVAKKHYFDENDLAKNSFYCNDMARRNFLSKRDGEWVRDPSGDLVKINITLPIAYQVCDYNEDEFKKTAENAGGLGKLTTAQIKSYDKNLVTCSNMLTDKLQDNIIKRMTSCRLKMKEDHIIPK
jgi:hypothetical protein